MTAITPTHTPGPWKVDLDSHASIGQLGVARCLIGRDNTGPAIADRRSQGGAYSFRMKLNIRMRETQDLKGEMAYGSR